MTSPEAQGPLPSKEDYIKLAEMTQADFASRRDLEWKLSLGLWGGIAAFTYAVFQIKTPATNFAAALPCCALIVIWLAIVGLHGFVLFLIQLSHSKDKQLYWWYRNKIEGGTRDRPWKENDDPSFCQKLEGFDWRWFVYHMAITGLVVAGALFLLAQKAAKEAGSV